MPMPVQPFVVVPTRIRRALEAAPEKWLDLKQPVRHRRDLESAGYTVLAKGEQFLVFDELTGDCTIADLSEALLVTLRIWLQTIMRHQRSHHAPAVNIDVATLLQAKGGA